MALPTEELKRRIDAARTLRGLKQKELAGLLEEDGLGKHDVGRLERGELDLRRVHLDALTRHLQMPEWWFTAEEIHLPANIGAPNAAELLDAVDALAELLLSSRDADRDETLRRWQAHRQQRSEGTSPESRSREGG